MKKLKSKKSELTIETVGIILLVLGLILVGILIIVGNKNSIEKILNFFSNLRR
ncbi:MAG: hypothetical protein QXM96_01460 [Candidatus Woesearchaeota archaeon]